VKILPAVDLLGGEAVRLVEGDRDRATVYSGDPAAMLARWAEAGAERAHVVDLDGAFAGEAAQRALVEALIAAATIPIQVGGGLRSAAAIDAVLAAGATGAVVGTAAVEQPEMVAEACRRHPGAIIVAVDAVAGMVATRGWTEAGETSAIALAERAAGWGAAAVLYTDVAVDGTERGPDVARTAALVDAVGDRIDVIASGGVGTLEHLRALAGTGAAWAIVGRALYEERFTLAEAIEAAR
jgi:phosphoribosylformimino-5-aminoimidazole carboxamide ribotide isomerase